MPSINHRHLQAFDWAQSPLGDRSGWPPEMNTAISMLMASDFPMCAGWGDYGIQIYNDAYNAIYGAKHPASFGAPVRESWPEIWEFLGPALDQVTTTGEALWFTETLLPLVKTSLPEECYFDFSYSPIRAADGTIIGILSVVAERTSEVVLRRRQRLSELDSARDSDDTFDVLMQTLSAVLVPNEMDCAKAVLYSVASETGAPDGEIWALRACQCFVRTMRPLAARALRRGKVSLNDSSSEVAVAVHAIGIPLYSLDGKPCACLVMLPNELVPLRSSALPFAEAISTRVHAALHAAEIRQREIGQMREEIAEQELIYQFLFNNIQDGVAYCATSGGPSDDEVILEVNPRLCELVGYTADEMIGMSRDAFFFPRDGVLAKALEIRSRDRHFTGELQLRRKDGDKFPVEMSSNLIEFSKGQTRSLTIIRDISYRRQLEEQQAERVRLETVANLAGSLAHDTNNLMTIVIGSTEFLSECLPVGGRERQMALNAMVAAERACGLTDQLLIYARQQPLAARPVDLNAFLEEIRPLIASAMGDANTLTISCEANLPSCMADPAQLTTAILNLATNARQAMPDCGVLEIQTFLPDTVATTTNDTAEPRPQQFVGLRVKDCGTGIPPAIQDRVFDPFFTTKEIGSGSGLGLSIVRRFVDEVGGALRMSSALGKGTIFELHFRLAEVAGSEDDEVETVFRAAGEVILYVEDNETVRHQTGMMLQQIGLDQIAFGNGREALEWIKAGGRADLLLSDLILPGGFSGLELATAALRYQPDLPVIITTGYDPRIAVAETPHRHFPVLRKPYTRRALENVLRRSLRAS